MLYLSHGAPPLADDALWTQQLADWSATNPRPRDILMVSAHWENAPIAVSSTTPGTPLTYDFWGFPQKYYEVTYDTPPATDLSQRVAGALSGGGEVLSTLKWEKMEIPADWKLKPGQVWDADVVEATEDEIAGKDAAEAEAEKEKEKKK